MATIPNSEGVKTAGGGLADERKSLDPSLHTGDLILPASVGAAPQETRSDLGAEGAPRTKELTLIPDLYRGDSLPGIFRDIRDPHHKGRTFADHFITEGVVAKFVDGGRPAMLDSTLRYLVAAHIGYAPESPEQAIARHSPLISFSSDVESALRFMDRTGRKVFQPCELWEASHFVWKLSGVRADEVEPGRYRLRYRASTLNVDQFRQRQLAEVQAGSTEGLMGALATQIVHEHLNNDQSDHVAELIEPAVFLRDGVDTTIEPGLRERAIDRARQSCEWLVFPCDPMPGGQGLDARLLLNELLSVHLWAKVATPKASATSPKRKK